MPSFCLYQHGRALPYGGFFRQIGLVLVATILTGFAACSSPTPSPELGTPERIAPQISPAAKETTSSGPPQPTKEAVKQPAPGATLQVAVIPEADEAAEMEAESTASTTNLAIVPLTFEETGRYEVVELEIQTVISPSNPFDPAELDIRVTFSPETGDEVEIGAFWYQAYDRTGIAPVGPPGWRARFSPPEIGRWTAVASIPALDQRGAPVTFQVVPSDNPGFVRINPNNPRYFAFDNGDFFFPVGINFAWWSGAGDALTDYGRWLDLFAANGGNAARIWMADWSFAIEWNDTPLGDYRNRLRRAWLLDQIFNMAEDRDIYIMLVLLNCADFNNWQTNGWNRNPYNEDNGGPLVFPSEYLFNDTAKELLKRRLKYITNRYGYSTHLLAWEWWNEVNLGPFPDEALTPWLQEMTAYLHEHDPNKHLVTNSYAMLDASPTFGLPEIDIIQKHEYAHQVDTPTKDIAGRVVADYNRLVNGIPPKPAIMGEFGYGTESYGTDIDRSGIHLHNGLWATAFAGYAGTGFYWYWDTYVELYQVWNHFRGISRFMEDVDLSGYEPFSPLDISGAGGQPGEATGLGLWGDDILIWLRSNLYTVQAATDAYFAKGLPQNFTHLPPLVQNQVVTLPVLVNGLYEIHWFDPQVGNWKSEALVEAQDHELSFSVPAFRRDMAARIVLIQ